MPVRVKPKREVMNTDPEFVEFINEFCEYIVNGTCDPYVEQIQTALDERVKRHAAEERKAALAKKKAPAVSPKVPSVKRKDTVLTPEHKLNRRYGIDGALTKGVEVEFLGVSTKDPKKYRAKVTMGNDRYVVGRVYAFPPSVFRELASTKRVGELVCKNCGNGFDRRPGRGRQPSLCPDCRP